jgi:ADP-heptose:LPS heptosyltransferase
MHFNPSHQRNILVFRLSSLGDVILSSAVLSPDGFAGPVDWVIASEFAPVLRGHPGIRKLWEFDRASGLSGWLKLCDELGSQGYDEVLDLHGSLRTRVARVYFWLQSRCGAAWRKLPKARWRLYGLYLFRKKWPAAWRPEPLVVRFARFAGKSGARPRLTHLAGLPAAREAFRSVAEALRTSGSVSYFCVMPGSKWAGKCWAASKYLEVCREVCGSAASAAGEAPSAASRGVRLKMPVVLGGLKDPGSQELVDLLTAAGIAHVSGVGKWDLTEAAGVLAGAEAYLGNDTGLAHLAEAVGVPALVVFGPTAPEMGFGPWREQSQSVGLESLGCRPCGKDGRRCYRLSRKYLCMNGLDATAVSERFKSMVAKKPIATKSEHS